MRTAGKLRVQQWQLLPELNVRSDRDTTPMVEASLTTDRDSAAGPGVRKEFCMVKGPFQLLTCLKALRIHDAIAGD